MGGDSAYFRSFPSKISRSFPDFEIPTGQILFVNALSLIFFAREHTTGKQFHSETARILLEY